MQAFLGQFYADRDPPPLILLSNGVDDPEVLMAEALSREGRPRSTSSCPSAARRRELVEGALRNARECLARRMSEIGDPGAAARRAGRGVRARRPARAGSRSTTTRHIMGTERGRRLVVAGPERLREGAVPQVQHPRRRPNPRRRLRHDERGADAPLHAPPQGGPGPRVRRLARPPADRRRRRARSSAVPRGAGRAGRPRHPDGRRRQGHRPRRSARRSSTGPAARPMALPPQRPGALLRPAAARRGAPLRHRHPPARSAPRPCGANPLDEIPGVGATRKRALLQHFGSAKAVARAASPTSRRCRRLGDAGRGDLRPLPREARSRRGA